MEYVQMLLPSVVSLLVVLWIHPKLVRIAQDKNIVDNPDARKLQRTPIPVLGGVAVFFGVVVGLGLTGIWSDDATVFPIVVAMMIMLYTGTMDDILNLSPALRFLIEIITVLLLIYAGGYRLDSFHGLWGIGAIQEWLAVPLTVFAAVGIINAINLIDGVDGLSSGYCIMACTMFGVLFYLCGDRAMAVLAVVCVGSLVSFFFHNVFGKTSKMFIGDGGTLVMGIVMSTFVVRTLQNGSAASEYVSANMGLIPFTLSVLSVPIFDTLRVMSRRILRGTSPFHPDKTHLHHLFIGLGFSHAMTTVSILTLNTLVVGAWYASYAAGATIGCQLLTVVVSGLGVTFGLYGIVSRLDPAGRAARLLRRLGRASHIERRGAFLFIQKVVDRR